MKKRRNEREAEKAMMEEEMERLQRERAMLEAAALERKEERFHYEMATQRAGIRI